jgi:hypothetical protein
MFYFNSFPKVLTTDYNNNAIILTNILKRVEIIPSLLKNPLLFYQYELQDGDTPEIVANKYYGDSYRYWIPLFANQTIDPQWDWALPSNLFDDYIVAKYSDAAQQANVASVLTYTQSTVQQYEKTVITTDSKTLTTSTESYIIDETSYNALVPNTIVRTFDDNSSITQTVSVSTVSIYDYEIRENENKRNINIVNSIYTSELESQFSSLIKS